MAKRKPAAAPQPAQAGPDPDLAAALDLDGARADRAAGGPALVADGRGPAAPTGPHCLALDRWAVKAGERLAADHPGSAFARVGPAAAADFFGAAFEPDPALLASPPDPNRARFLAELLGSADYHALHADSQADPLVSEIAAAHFAQGFEVVEQKRKRREDDPPGRRSRPGPNGRPVRPPPPPAGGGEGEGRMDAARAAARACRAARQEAADCRDAAAALGGAGAGPGGPAGSLDAKAAAEVFRRVRNDASLRRVVELAGGFRRLMGGLRQQVCPDARAELAGVAPAADPRDLLPASLALLALPHPALRARAAADLVGRRLLGWDRTAREPVGLGPVLCTIDQSGSMTGRKSEQAKGLALAVAFSARRKNRWCALVSYSGTGNGAEDVLVLPPGRPWEVARVCDWVARFLGGGNMCDVPVRELPGYYDSLGAPPGRTDVLMITDDQLAMPDDWIPPFLDWRRRARVRATGVVVGGAGGGQLGRLCDRLVRAADLSPDGEAARTAVQDFL